MLIDDLSHPAAPDPGTSHDGGDAVPPKPKRRRALAVTGGGILLALAAVVAVIAATSTGSEGKADHLTVPEAKAYAELACRTARNGDRAAVLDSISAAATKDHWPETRQAEATAAVNTALVDDCPVPTTTRVQPPSTTTSTTVRPTTTTAPTLAVGKPHPNDATARADIAQYAAKLGTPSDQAIDTAKGMCIALSSGSKTYLSMYQEISAAFDSARAATDLKSGEAKRSELFDQERDTHTLVDIAAKNFCPTFLVTQATKDDVAFYVNAVDTAKAVPEFGSPDHQKQVAIELCSQLASGVPTAVVKSNARQGITSIQGIVYGDSLLLYGVVAYCPQFRQALAKA